jgi:hypothetical protein
MFIIMSLCVCVCLPPVTFESVDISLVTDERTISASWRYVNYAIEKALLNKLRNNNLKLVHSRFLTHPFRFIIKHVSNHRPIICTRY